MVFPHIFGALAGGDHGEAAGPCPVDQFADQCRLVAIGEAVNHTSSLGVARQQWACEDVSLHIHHHDVLAFTDRSSGMGDPGGSVAGGLTDDLYLWASNNRNRVV